MLLVTAVGLFHGCGRFGYEVIDVPVSGLAGAGVGNGGSGNAAGHRPGTSNAGADNSAPSHAGSYHSGGSNAGAGNDGASGGNDPGTSGAGTGTGTGTGGSSNAAGGTDPGTSDTGAGSGGTGNAAGTNPGTSSAGASAGGTGNAAGSTNPGTSSARAGSGGAGTTGGNRGGTGGAGGTGANNGGIGSAAGSTNPGTGSAGIGSGGAKGSPSSLQDVCQFTNVVIIEGTSSGDVVAAQSMTAALAGACGNAQSTRQVSQDLAGVLDASGRPLIGPAELVVISGGFVTQKAMAYLDQNDTPVYGSITAKNNHYCAFTRGGTQVFSIQNGNFTSSYDVAILTVTYEPTSQTFVLDVYGFNSAGTRAGAFYFVNTLAPTLKSNSNHYYIVEWTDQDGDLAASIGDRYSVLASG